MKLPLFTKKIDTGEIFHVLAFEGDLAIGVIDQKLMIDRVQIHKLRVLSDDELNEWKIREESEA